MTIKEKKELEKQIESLKRELNYDHVTALLEVLNESEGVLNVIVNHGLSDDDCRHLAQQIGSDFEEIYKKYEPDLVARQTRRKKKNDARRERLARKKATHKQDLCDGITVNSVEREERAY